MNIQTFHHSGFNFSYSIEGTGETILVPGGPAHYSQTFGDELKQKFRFIFVDHRGFAPISEADANKRPTMEELVEDLESFRKHLNLESFYLLGHSGHAYLALAYANSHAGHLKGLILLSAGPDLSLKNQQAADEYFDDMADEKRKKIHSQNLEIMKSEMVSNPGDEFRIFCIRSAARSSYDPNFNPAPLWKPMHLNLSIVLHMWSHLFVKELKTEDLENLSVPVFIGLGLHDYQVPPHFTWNPYKKYIKNLAFRVFPQSGHNPQMEEPETFARELALWIAKNQK